MPRQPRLSCPGILHHVMARGIEGRDIFKDDRDREWFLNRLADVMKAPGSGRIYAWALMSNHFHLLIRPDHQPLSEIMSHLLTAHAVNFNLRHRRKGHLFQNRFKSIVVEEDAYFLELVRYIHLNPVRAGIITDLDGLDDYSFTGHSTIIGARQFPPQDVTEVLAMFSPRRQDAVSAYRAFVGDGLRQGAREEFRGGGLFRSAGGLRNVLERGFKGAEQWDERILGCGEFVEAILAEKEVPIDKTPDVIAIVQAVASANGITEAEIIGGSKDRAITAARREFYLRAHTEGISATFLAKMTGRSHVAVIKALKKRTEATDPGKVTKVTNVP